MGSSVTVIIPAFNEALGIERCVRQVLDEPWPDDITLRHVIVVDDCSDDATGGITARLADEDRRVTLLTNGERRGKNYGIWAATALASTDMVAVLDADVFLSPGSLAQTIRFLQQRPDYAGSSCLMRPLPPRSWRGRASYAQALLCTALQYSGAAYLTRLYILRGDALAALRIPEGVADDAYITLWLRAHALPYAVCPTATGYFAVADGLRDFAKQTLRGRLGETATRAALPAVSSRPTGDRAVPRAITWMIRQDPWGSLLYTLWYAIVLATPARWWLSSVSLSTFDAAASTKSVAVRRAS